MKRFTLFLFLITTIPCLAQTLFFDDLNTATWTSDFEISDSTLKNSKQIPLSKLVYSKDSIRKDVTIWTFRDSVLTIVKYDYQKKNERIAGTYTYRAVQDKCILQIMLPDNSVLTYNIGIVSSGYYAVLFQTKKKKPKPKL